MTKDLTAGRPFKSILFFTLPIFVGNVFQQLYSMIDAIIVGHTISDAALAGVGATGAISFLVIGFVQGLTAGFAVKTSQLCGAGDTEGIKRSIASSVALSVVLSVLLTLISVFTTMPLLKLMQTPDDIIQYSYDYIVTIYWGLAASVFYNLASSILRALGDSRTPLVFLIIAALLNIAFDFAFILGLGTGVEGAGWATVLSQALSAIGCFVYMFVRFPVCRVRAKQFLNKPLFYLQHLAIGIPMALQYSITAIGMMVQQTALNKLGTQVVTAYTAASKVDNLAQQSMAALGTAVATYAGQNYGAGKFKRIKEGVNQSMLTGAVCAVLSLVLVVTLAKPLTMLFVDNPSEEIVALSKEFLLWQGVFYIALAAIFVYRNALQGIGRSALTMIAGATELAMRSLASIFLAKWFGFTGICFSSPSAWVGADVFLLIAYFVIMHRVIKKALRSGAENPIKLIYEKKGVPNDGKVTPVPEAAESAADADKTVSVSAATTESVATAD